VRIYVKAVDGEIVKFITLDVDTTDIVVKIKQKVQDLLGFRPEQQKFVYSGKLLEDDVVLADCDIRAESTILLTLDCRGS